MDIRSTVAAAFGLGGVFFLSMSSAEAQAPPPVEAYGRLPAVGGVSISPNGERLAVIVSQGDATAFQVINLDTGQTEHNYGVPAELSLRGVTWPDDHHAIMSVSRATLLGVGSRRGEIGRLVSFTLSNQRQRDLPISSGLRPVPNEPGMAYGTGRDESRRLAIYRVNLSTATSRRIQSTLQDTSDVLFDDQGALLARIDSNSDTNQWWLYLYDEGTARLVLEGVSDIGLEPIALAGVHSDGRVVAVGRRPGDDRDRLFALSSSGETEVLFDHERYDVGSAILEPRTNRVVGVRWTEDLPRQRFFDSELEALAERVRGFFPTGYADVRSWSRDRQRFIVFAETSRDAGAFYLYDVQANSMRSIARRYPELTTEAAIGERQSIMYPARDGTRIPAYLTLPAGGGRNLPLVLMPHGGPHARDTFAFDWWAAFLASRGYAVLQPNFRGSTGYGHAWFDAGRGNWGDGVMQTDIEDGVDALISAGIADASRVCIVGASYGGYATLAGATMSPQRYRCAISVAGVSELVRMLDDTARMSGSSYSAVSTWWRYSIGDRRNERDRLRSISPANLAENVRAPILLIHGNNDSVVPIVQSRLMESALRSAGKDVRFVVLEGDDHWLSNASTRIRMLSEIESFLAQHMRPGQVSVDDSGAAVRQ
jgi:dipeptidyl aminopeptidase/acylaminoacyl peptidase